MLRLFSLCHHLEIYTERQRGEGAEGTGWVGFTTGCGKKPVGDLQSCVFPRLTLEVHTEWIWTGGSGLGEPWALEGLRFSPSPSQPELTLQSTGLFKGLLTVCTSRELTVSSECPPEESSQSVHSQRAWGPKTGTKHVTSSFQVL